MRISRGHGCYWLPMDIYPAYVCFVPSEAAWTRLNKHLGVQEPGQYVRPMGGRMTALENNKTGELCLAVMLHNSVDKDPTNVVGSLVHEATHVWQQIREHIGEKRPGHEQEAYFMEFLVKALMEAYASAKKAGERRKR